VKKRPPTATASRRPLLALRTPGDDLATAFDIFTTSEGFFFAEEWISVEIAT